MRKFSGFGRYLLAIVGLAGLVSVAQAQVGIGILNVDSSAALQLESTTRGFAPPRMSAAQRDAINNPLPGLMVYVTDDSTQYYWNDECWIPFYLENCDDCAFNFGLSATSVNIDRVVQDSAEVLLNVTQTFGSTQPISFAYIGNLPTGVTLAFDSTTVQGSGQTRLVVKVALFAQGGQFPVVVQAFCGTMIKNIILLINVVPCYEITFFNNATNVNLAALVYGAYPSAPMNTPFCVIADVQPGVVITGTTPTTPAFSTGTGAGVGPTDLPTGSVLGLLNEGEIIGRGGGGGTAYNIATGTPNGDGESGGHALSLTCKTEMQAFNGKLFGGGGGGASSAVGFFQSISFPIIGGFSFCGVLGASGGGGAGFGPGGNFLGAGCTFNLNSLVSGIYATGQPGTGGQFGSGGNGGFVQQSVSIPVSPLSVTVTVNADGGDGGDYGFPGGPSDIAASVAAGVTIPFIGTISVNIITVNAGTLGVNLPQPGLGGNAVKRNGNPFLPLPDSFYTTNNFKGTVGN